MADKYLSAIHKVLCPAFFQESGQDPRAAPLVAGGIQVSALKKPRAAPLAAGGIQVSALKKTKCGEYSPHLIKVLEFQEPFSKGSWPPEAFK